MANAGAAAAEGEDAAAAAVDVLPDSVISLILSKLVDARRVAQAAMVCRRWRSCALGVTRLQLNFPSYRSCCGFHSDDDDDEGEEEDEDEDSEDSSESSEGECCFGFHRRRSIRTALTVAELGEKFSRFIRNCAALRELSIRGMFCVNRGTRDLLDQWLAALPPCLEEFKLEGKFSFSLGQLGHCSKLSRLYLSEVTSKSMPLEVPAGSQFSSIRTCVLKSLQMDDAKLELLVSLCPALEDLRLLLLHGISSPCLNAANLLRLDISSTVDKAFYDEFAPGIRSLKITAPKLQRLAVNGVAEVVADGGPALVELVAGSYFTPAFRKKTTSLRDLTMGGKGWTLTRVMDFMGFASGAAHKLSIVVTLNNGESPKLTFGELFAQFSELATLELGKDLFTHLEEVDNHSEAEIDLPMLKELSVCSGHGNKVTISLLSKILENASNISKLRVWLEDRPSGSFSTSLLKLQAKYHKVAFDLQTAESSEEDASEEYEDEDEDDISDEHEDWREDEDEEDGSDEEVFQQYTTHSEDDSDNDGDNGCQTS